MKLLITGANGQLGHGIIDAGQSKECRVQAPSEADPDITDLTKGDHIITDLQPNLVITTAAKFK
jgi:dTDP-4-dehydrorhamnose reductase